MIYLKEPLEPSDPYLFGRTENPYLKEISMEQPVLSNGNGITNDENGRIVSYTSIKSNVLEEYSQTDILTEVNDILNKSSEILKGSTEFNEDQINEFTATEDATKQSNFKKYLPLVVIAILFFLVK